MTRLITVTKDYQNEKILINIDFIVSISSINYETEANSIIKLQNEEIHVIETLDALKELCNL
jgi:hypothetical protein